MHVKRLYRPTVREALAAARQELGPGALVLSTELVPAPGWRGWMGQRTVRLTAAAERPEEGLSEAPEVSTDRPDVTAHRHLPNAAQAGLIARLQAAGLSATLAESVVRRMTPSECRGGSEAVLVRALAAELESTRGDDDAYARYEVFVGPPGVGKTTTIAKNAAAGAGGQRPSPWAWWPLMHFAPAPSNSCAATRRCSARRSESRAVRRNWMRRSTRRATPPLLIPPPVASDPSLTSLSACIENRRNVRTHLVMAADTSLASARRAFWIATPP
jgi:flagellar biosynthesis GTPase FlhF